MHIPVTPRSPPARMRNQRVPCVWKHHREPIYRMYPQVPMNSVSLGPSKLLIEPPKNPAIQKTPYRTELEISDRAL